MAFIGHNMSYICSHCNSGEEMAELLLLSCPKEEEKRQHHVNESIDITDVSRLHRSDGILTLLGTFASPYRHCLTGISHEQQQQLMMFGD